VSGWENVCWVRKKGEYSILVGVIVRGGEGRVVED
jgi:hypothetical protein